jgi:hypothetical protein
VGLDAAKIFGVCWEMNSAVFRGLARTTTL